LFKQDDKFVQVNITFPYISCRVRQVCGMTSISNGVNIFASPHIFAACLTSTVTSDMTSLQ